MAEPTGGRARGGRAGRGQRPDDDGNLRGLVGDARSKVSLSAAMRARDVARPGPDDLAEAELWQWARPPADQGPRRPRRRRGGEGGRQSPGAAGTGGSTPVRS